MQYLPQMIIILGPQFILYHHLKLPISIVELSIKEMYLMEMLFYNIWMFFLFFAPPMIKFIFCSLKNNVFVTFTKVRNWPICFPWVFKACHNYRRSIFWLASNPLLLVQLVTSEAPLVSSLTLFINLKD